MTLQEAVAYLKEQDLAAMEVGTYEVDGDFYFMIREYETKEPAVCRLETHKNYIDIQWIISGEEAIDTVNVAGLTVEEAYDADRDVAFWKKPAEMCHIVLSSGSYAILPPSIAHQPGMRAGSLASPVKKCVGKVRVH